MELDMVKFYKHMLQYIGTTESGGLCHHLRIFAADYGLNVRERAMLVQQLVEDFKRAGMDETYPFEDGDGVAFSIDNLRGELYQNERRIEWIRKHAKA